MKKLPYDEWKDELEGYKPSHSSWWLVMLAIPAVMLAVHCLKWLS